MITEIKNNNGKITTIPSLDKFKTIIYNEVFGFWGDNSIYDCEVRQGNGEWMKITKAFKSELIKHGGVISNMLDAQQKSSQEEKEKLLKEEREKQEESDSRTEMISKLTKDIENDWTNISWSNLQLALSLCESLYLNEYECNYSTEMAAVEKLLYAVTKNLHLPAMLSNRMLIRLNQKLTENLTENNLSIQALATSNQQIETAIRSGNKTKTLAAGAGLIMANQMLGEIRDSDD